MNRNSLLAALCACLSGCAVLEDARVTNAGLPVHEDSVQLVDLPLVLDPGRAKAPNPEVQKCIEANAAVSLNPDKCKGVYSGRHENRAFSFRKEGVSGQEQEDDEEVFQRLRLETALWAFYENKTSTQTLEARRTQVQHRILMAADANCGIFINRIFEVQATGNFAFGTAATVLGGWGSIVTDAPSARLLSGLSAMSTGIRAEANEDFFRKQWIEALAKAIENQRNRLREGMQKRSTDAIAVYPVQAAIADALRYNDACSLVSGLKEVNRAVTIADDPAGLRAFRESYDRAGFDAKFTATLNSDGEARSARLQAVSPAAASIAVVELARDLAALRTDADAVKGKLPASADLESNKAKINEVVATVSGESAYGPDLKTLIDRLVAFKTEYDALAADLAAATSDTKRQETLDLMEANDTAAEKVRTSAAGVLVKARIKIQDILTAAEEAATEAATKAESDRASAENDAVTKAGAAAAVPET